MINPMLFKYTVVVVTEDGSQHDITDHVTELSWDEEENQLPVRISVTARNSKTPIGYISDFATPGCWIGVLASYNKGKNQEVCRGKIVDWSPSNKSNGNLIALKAYDILYDLNESQDNIYYTRGKKTKKIISKILKKWKVSVSEYTGPNVKHGKVIYKSEKVGTAIIKVLKEAHDKGGKDAFLQSDKESVKVLGYGSNKVEYCFNEEEHMVDIKHTISTAGMVTRVKVTGQKKKSGKSPVRATVNGQTEYGIRQKLVSVSKNEKMKDAKKQAKQVIKDDGEPKDNLIITVPDVPTLRKGSLIYVEASTVETGEYYIVGASHNGTARTMTLTLVDEDKKKDSDDKKKYKVGKVVTFTGKKCYNSNNGGSGQSVKGSGKAKITKVKDGAAHPYYLVTRNASKCTVKGWVDEGSFS